MEKIKKKLLVINAFSALRGGGQTYLINLFEEFCKIETNLNIVVLTNCSNKNKFDRFKNPALKFIEVGFASKNVMFRTLWEVFKLPFFLRDIQADAYFSPGGIMITKMPTGCKSYTVLRNMLPFENRERKRFSFFSYDRFRLFVLKYLFLISYKISDGVIFISNYSRNGVKKFIPDIKEKSVVIYHGINKDFIKTKENNESSGTIVDGNYYLYVSILDSYKAQKEVIYEWLNIAKNIDDCLLVLAGPKINNYGEQVEEMLSNVDKKTINYIGAIDYNALPNLYKNARALIFASSCECCPNILLEKLASGRPVICSNKMPMPEFGQDAVVYFDPYKKGSLGRAIQFIEKDGNINKFSLKSSIRASSFCWTDTASKTFNYLLPDN